MTKGKRVVLTILLALVCAIPWWRSYAPDETAHTNASSAAYIPTYFLGCGTGEDNVIPDRAGKEVGIVVLPSVNECWTDWQVRPADAPLFAVWPPVPAGRAIQIEYEFGDGSRTTFLFSSGRLSESKWVAKMRFRNLNNEVRLAMKMQLHDN